MEMSKVGRPQSLRFASLSARYLTLEQTKSPAHSAARLSALTSVRLKGRLVSVTKSCSQADLDDKLKRGFYLVTIGHCMECHTSFAYAATAGQSGRLTGRRGV
jgi:hypothetical protein